MFHLTLIVLNEDSILKVNAINYTPFPASSEVSDKGLHTPTPPSDQQMDTTSDLMSFVLPTNKNQSLKRKQIR